MSQQIRLRACRLSRRKLSETLGRDALGLLLLTSWARCGSFDQLFKDQIGEEEVSDVVCGELHLQTIFIYCAFWQVHDA